MSINRFKEYLYRKHYFTFYVLSRSKRTLYGSIKLVKRVCLNEQPAPTVTQIVINDDKDIIMYRNKSIELYFLYKPHRKAKVVVYTCVVGAYDHLLDIQNINPEWDYICFSDTKLEEGSQSYFEIRPIQYTKSDGARTARYHKLNPHILFPEYDTFIWLDGKVKFNQNEDFYQFFETFQQSSKNIALLSHKDRTTVGEECTELEKSSRLQSGRFDTVHNLKEHAKRNQGFEDAPLFETCFVIRKNTEEMIQLDTQWWNELNRYSKRDQLSLPYVIKKNNIPYEYIVNKDINHKSCSFLTVAPHHQVNNLEHVSWNKDSINLAPFQGSLGSEDIKDITVDVVVCVHNAHEDVIRCIESLLLTLSDNYNVVIVDDGSDAPTKEYLEQVKQENSNKVTLLRNPSGSGYTVAANQGIRATSADFVITLNSDTIVSPKWIEKMLQVAYSSANIGIVGPLSNAASYQSIPRVKNRKTRDWAINDVPLGFTIESLNQYLETTFNNQYTNTSVLNGFCFGCKREVYDKIGLFDQELFPTGFGEENDFCFRAAEAGFLLMVSMSTYVFHAKSKSFGSKSRIALGYKNEKHLINKHGKNRIHRAVVAFEKNYSLQLVRDTVSEKIGEAVSETIQETVQETLANSQSSLLDKEATK